jgi:hypothetical protein
MGKRKNANDMAALVTQAEIDNEIDKRAKGRVSFLRRVPLTVEMISEGELLADINDELSMVESHMVRFVERFGDNANKGKGKVIVTIMVEYDSEAPMEMTITGKTNSIVPKRPGRSCRGGIDRMRKAVVCLPSGATEDDPGQGRLCTKDGRAVDPDTGEVRP